MKELEEYKYSNLELLREIWFNVPEGSQKIHQKHFDLILSKLNELQSIKEAKSSEAVECLEKVKGYRTGGINSVEVYLEETEEYNTIKNALLKAQELEKENAEHKKVFEIIEKKCFETDNFYYVRICYNYDEYKKINEQKYNTAVVKINWNDRDLLDYLKLLTEEEFDILKRWSEK